MGRFLSSAILSRFLAPMVGSCLRIGADRSSQTKRRFATERELELEAKQSEGSSPFSADHRAAYLYSAVPVLGPDHEAIIRFGGKAPRRRAHSNERFDVHVRARVTATSDRDRPASVLSRSCGSLRPVGMRFLPHGITGTEEALGCHQL